MEGDTWQRRRFNASLFQIDGNVPHCIAPWCKCGRLVLGQGAKVLSGSARVFVHHIVEVEIVGQKEEQSDQRDDGEEVNGDVEAVRETHNNAHEP